MFIDLDFNDSKMSVFYFANQNEFITLDKHSNKIIKKLSNSSDFDKLYKEYLENESSEIIDINFKMCLIYYHPNNKSLSNGLSSIATYIKLIDKFKGMILIPENSNKDLTILLLNIYPEKIILLKKNKIYKINNILFSKYLDIMNDINILKPNNKLPLIDYNNEFEWFRKKINYYVDKKYKPKNFQIFKKIIICNTNINKPISNYIGYMSGKLIDKFKTINYEYIDLSNKKLIDIIYLIRNSNEIILSIGNIAKLFVPFINKTTKVYLLSNVLKEMDVFYDSKNSLNSDLFHNNNEYNHSIILKYLNNYKVIFYKNLLFVKRLKNKYDGECQLNNFFRQQKLKPDFKSNDNLKKQKIITNDNNHNQIVKKNNINNKLINFINQKNHKPANDYINDLLKKINQKRNLYNTKSKKMYKILYFVNAEYFIRKMSRVRFLAILKLIDIDNIDLYFTGPGWENYDIDKTIYENIVSKYKNLDFIIWYKPLDKINKFDINAFNKIPFKKCIRYNEMWDEKWTRYEIDNSNSDLIICHHKNDYEKYEKIYKNDINKKIVYIPHHADPSIFYDMKIDKDIDILISGVTKEKHYPLKHKLLKIIQKNKDTKLKQYKIHILEHPGYHHDDSYTNRVLTNYSKYINRSKICIACTSKHNYRLGKYVEIPMCGSVVFGDLPYEDRNNLKNIIIPININSTEDEIINKLLFYLDPKNKYLLDYKSKIGKKWAKKSITSLYCNNLLDSMKKYEKKPKIFIISDEIRDNHPEFKNEKWCCDVLKNDFKNFFPNIVTNNPLEADIIWYFAPWNYRFKPNQFSNYKKWLLFLETKKVISTFHHIDIDKFKKGEYTPIFNFSNKYSDKYHVLCKSTYEFISNHIDHKKPIVQLPLWVNDSTFFNINSDSKIELKKKYNLNSNNYLIGSFQKDTEGTKKWKCSNCFKMNTFKINEINYCSSCDKKKDLEKILYSPKLSKGPDIFVKVILDMKKKQNNIAVVLTGLRREYLISELEKNNIKYFYFEMLSLEEINELYNCLDLYLVTSRYEGGPRSIYEASITKTPIISTDVGVASLILDEKSIFDKNDYESYKLCRPNVEYAFNKINQLKKENHIYKFYEKIMCE